MKRKWLFQSLVGLMLCVLQIGMQQSFAEDEVVSEPPEENEQSEMTKDIQERLVTVGSGSLSGTYATGSTGQSIITMTYTYTPTLDLSLGGQPVIMLQLPPEIANEINGSNRAFYHYLEVQSRFLPLPR